MTITLHRKTGRNRFCGPSAISILTGGTSDQGSRLIRSINGRRQVTGTHAEDLLLALLKCGIGAVQTHDYARRDRPTLIAWVRGPTFDPGATYLVSAAHHWQIIQGDRYACGIVGKPVPLDHPKVKRRGFVTAAYRLEPVGPILCPDVDLPTDQARRDAFAAIINPGRP